jgi:peptidoglycan/xylan/chitin deacetylase (PgdA/CDA1 family)
MNTQHLTTHFRNIAGVIGNFTEKPIFIALKRMQGGIILAYHRVAPTPDPFYQPIHPNLFRRQIQLIKSHFVIISLEEFVVRLQNGKSLLGCCAITFDDGYKDFEIYAYPILKDLEIPVTHFVTCDGLLKGLPTWNYRLNRLLHSIDLSDDFLPLKLDKGPPSWAHILRITNLLSSRSSLERQKILERLEKNYKLSSDPLMLQPADLLRMDKEIVKWGSHTVSHASLVDCSTSEISFELLQSRQTIERALGEQVKFLAYPNGHFNSLAMNIAAESGYIASFAVGQRRVMSDTSIHSIPRFDLGGLHPNMIGLELSGITPLLRKIRDRLAEVKI